MLGVGVGSKTDPPAPSQPQKCGTTIIMKHPPDQDTNQGLKIAGKIMLAAYSTSASVQMIASLDNDVKPLA